MNDQTKLNRPGAGGLCNFVRKKAYHGHHAAQTASLLFYQLDALPSFQRNESCSNLRQAAQHIDHPIMSLRQDLEKTISSQSDKRRVIVMPIPFLLNAQGLKIAAWADLAKILGE